MTEVSHEMAPAAHAPVKSAHGEPEIVARISAFLAEQGVTIPATDDPRDVPLLENDLLDSLSVVQLTVFLGDTFDVAIDDDDFEAENFATVGTLAALIARKRGAADA